MDKKEIATELITSLMFYGVVSGWSSDELREKYSYLGIPEELVNETLNKGIE